MLTHEQLIGFMKAARETASDNVALDNINLFPFWKPDESVSAGDRKQYNGSLYKCIQAHTTQTDWHPDTTPALWDVIDVEHAGTYDDPIPSEIGMEYEYGKYYSYDGIIYICQRTGESAGGKITLYYVPPELIGQYFEVA